METAYYILNSYLSPVHCVLLLALFAIVFAVWKVVAKKTTTHSILISLFVTYIFFILLITLIARTPADTRNIKLIPFWSWYEVIVNGDRGLLVEIILNVVLFVPVGIISRLLDFPLRRVALFSLFLSLSIELTQYFTCRGLCEIFDDVIGNTCGGVIGNLGCGYVVRICVEKRHNPSAKKQ